MTRQPGIPGTIGALNERVQAVLSNHLLSHKARGEMATAIIAEKVLLAYRLTE